MHARKPRLNDGYFESHPRSYDNYKSSKYRSASYSNRERETSPVGINGTHRSGSPEGSPRDSRDRDRHQNSSYKIRNKERDRDYIKKDKYTDKRNRDRDLEHRSYVPSKRSKLSKSNQRDGGAGGSSSDEREKDQDRERERDRLGRFFDSRDHSGGSNTTNAPEKITRVGDWTEQVSRVGKKYYYNNKTYLSQWEKPREWLERERALSKETLAREYREKERDRNKSRDDRYTTSSRGSYSKHSRGNSRVRWPHDQEAPSTSSSGHHNKRHDENADMEISPDLTPTSEPSYSPSSTPTASSTQHNNNSNSTNNDDTVLLASALPRLLSFSSAPTTTNHQLLHQFSNASSASNNTTNTLNSNKMASTQAASSSSSPSLLHQHHHHSHHHHNSTHHQLHSSLNELHASLNGNKSSSLDPSEMNHINHLKGRIGSSSVGNSLHDINNSHHNSNSLRNSPNFHYGNNHASNNQQSASLQQQQRIDLNNSGGSNTLNSNQMLIGDGPPTPTQEMDLMSNNNDHRKLETTASTVSSLHSMTSQASRMSGPNLTPSLAKYFRADLITHVTNWASEILEKQAQKCAEDVYMLGDLECSKISTEIKCARSIVRVAEIASIIQGQKKLFLQEQIKSLEDVQTQDLFMPSRSDQ
ncbi:unnamed protein product [Diamesa serratosioi]